MIRSGTALLGHSFGVLQLKSGLKGGFDIVGFPAGSVFHGSPCKNDESVPPENANAPDGVCAKNSESFIPYTPIFVSKPKRKLSMIQICFQIQCMAFCSSAHKENIKPSCDFQKAKSKHCLFCHSTIDWSRQTHLPAHLSGTDRCLAFSIAN